jgi:hypothetical protein
MYVAFHVLTGIWKLLSVVFAAGAFGGLINAFLTDNGFTMAAKQKVESRTIFVPGAFGNVLFGAVAASISWGLYGPFANIPVVSLVTPVGTPGNAGYQAVSISASGFLGAVLVGVGGARWLAAEVDKKVLASAAVKAASSDANADAAREMVGASPSNVLRIAKDM